MRLVGEQGPLFPYPAVFTQVGPPRRPVSLSFARQGVKRSAASLIGPAVCCRHCDAVLAGVRAAF